MAAYSNILPSPMQDLTNFTDDIHDVDTNGTLLDATRMVLEEDNTAQWIVDMLTLTRYYRVRFKHRKTVQKFIWHYLFLTENKENQVYTEEQLFVLHRAVKDLTNYIDQRKCDVVDENHWPVDKRYMDSLVNIYEAFPMWKDEQFHRVYSWYNHVLAVKEEIERECNNERGLSMKDIFDSHLQYYRERGMQIRQHDVSHISNTVMYTDNNLIPPPLQSGTDIDYVVV